MFRRTRGFSLIEMLIVVALIGILTALLIPQVLSAVQKAKQKGTMKDMNDLANSIFDHITDLGFAPEQNGAVSAGSDFYKALSPFYHKVIPIHDQWGSPFYIYCGSDAISSAGIDGVTASGSDDFLIISYGSDRLQTPFVFAPLDPETVFFTLTSLRSFGEDLAVWNGSWIHVPKSAYLAD